MKMKTKKRKFISKHKDAKSFFVGQLCWPTFSQKILASGLGVSNNKK